MIYRLLCLFVLINIFSCAKKSSSVLGHKGKVITFGNGGGFTGAVTSIYILDNGEIFRGGLSDTSFIKIGNLDQTKTQQLFNNYTNLKIDQMKLDEPGNRYFFIHMKQGTSAHKVVWGANELKNKAPSLLFKIAMEYVKKIEQESTKQSTIK